MRMVLKTIVLTTMLATITSTFSMTLAAQQNDQDEAPVIASKTKCELVPEEYRKTDEDHQQECLFENWYVTASFGFASGDFSTSQVSQKAAEVGFDVFDIDVDDSRAAAKIAIGTSVTERISIELGYVDLGEVKAAFSTRTDDPDNFFALTNTIHPTSTKGFAVSGVYQFLRQEDWYLQLRLGLFFWDGDFDSLDVFGARPVTNNSSADGTDLYFGIGGNYQLDDSLQLVLEWERYRFDLDQTDLLSVGLTYHF